MADLVFRALNQNDVSTLVMRRIRMVEEELFDVMMATRELRSLVQAFPQDQGLQQEYQNAQMKVLQLNIRLKTLVPTHDMDGVPMEFGPDQAVMNVGTVAQDTSEPESSDEVAPEDPGTEEVAEVVQMKPATKPRVPRPRKAVKRRS